MLRCTRTASVHPGRGGQRDLPVDPRRPAAGVALRDLPHADQRVRPGPQHHLLQGPDLGQILLLCRLEDPAPQPPYVVLVQPPVNSVPLQGHVLGSVHRHGRLTCPSVPAYPALRLTKAHPPHVSLLSQPGTRPGIRPVIRAAPGWRTGTALPLSCCLSAAGIRFLGVLFPPGDWAPLTVGLPAAPRRRRRTLTGFPRSARMRYGRAGCPLYPGGDGVPRGHRDVRGRRLPPCNGWPLPPRYCQPTRDVRLTRHQQGFRVIHPSAFPSPVTPGRNGRPRAFP